MAWEQSLEAFAFRRGSNHLWDWSLVEEKGQRLENFVASHLLKAIHFWTDRGFGDFGLYFLRDKEKNEVDFLVTKNEKPWFLVEVKAKANGGISKALFHFQHQTSAPHAFQVAFDLPYVNKDCFSHHEPIIVPASTFLSQLI